VRAAVASADASSLKVLDLSFNALVSLDDDGTPVEAGGCFASLPALEDLRVGDNALTTLRSSNLERLGDTLRSLRAQNNALRCLTGLEKMRALETLRVDGNASLGSPDIEQRASLPGIPGVVNGLASLPSALTCLNLSRCALTSLDGFQNAACARRLEELRLDGNAFAAPNAFEPLRNCARLVELHVADARLTPASLAGLRALAPTLETLVLDGNPGLAERAKESSRTMHTNKQLIRTTTPRRQIVTNDDARDVANALKNDDVGVLALRRAPRLPALTSLSVSRCGARALGPSGWSLADVAPKLERLDASRNRFATPAALGAARALRGLREASLAGNPMCFEAFEAFEDPHAEDGHSGRVLSSSLDGTSHEVTHEVTHTNEGGVTEKKNAAASRRAAYFRAVAAALPRVAFVDGVAVSRRRRRGDE
jgi:Leucine-rich repeat (LRR) protein